MGVVYLARQTGLNRAVALKMVLAGEHARPDDLRRFLQEAETVAQLKHVNVVQVHEVGHHQGRPYMALEYCDGGSLDRQLAGSPQEPRRAAGLVAAVARGVQAAHDAGIVHRDLKPQNILLAGDGTPKVTDFGLAKRAGSGSDLTATGAILGTPSYMAPEQAEGKGKEVGPAADIYALGAVLYDALTGRPPFRAATPLDTVLQVVSAEPVPPRRLNPQVPADLETIALKCLQKQPAKRYASAAELADDLDRWAAGKPIQARPVGRIERGVKWVRRNPVVTAATIAVSLSLLLGTVVSTAKYLEAKAQEAEAKRQAGIAGEKFVEAEAARAAEASRVIERDEALRAAEKRAADLKAERGMSAEFRYAAGINRAFAEWQALNTNYARTALNEAPPHLRGWEWDFLERQFDQSSVPLRGHAAQLMSVAMNPDGSRAYTLAFDKTVRVWDARTGGEVKAHNLNGHRLAASPDGRRLAVATGQAVRIVDPESGREIAVAHMGDFPCGLAYVRGGTELVVVTVDGTVTVRDPATLAERRRSPKRLALESRSTQLLNLGIGVAVSPDGRFIAQGGYDCKVRLWDVATADKLMEGEGHLKLVGECAFSPDGKLLASPGGEGAVRLWDTEARKTVRTLRGHKSWVWAVAFSRDGTRLASAAKDMTARVWDPATGHALLTLTGHAGEARSLAFSGDGSRLVTGSADGSARVWDPADRIVGAEHVKRFFASRDLPDFGRTGSAEFLTFYGHVAPVMSVACSPDGRLVATSGAGDEHAVHQVVVWDVDARREVAKLPTPPAPGHPLAFTPDGKRLLVATTVDAKTAPTVTAFDIGTSEAAWKWKWSGPAVIAASPAASPDGKHVAVLGAMANTGTLVLLDASTGTEVRRTELPARPATFAYASDGKSVFIAEQATGKVRAVDPATGEGREWAASNSGLTAIAAGPDNLVATADGRATITLWDATTGEKRETLSGHAGVVLQMAFGPAGRLVSAGNDMTARVWDTGNGHELLTFRDHNEPVVGVAWSRDGSRLATACVDGALRVWQGPAADAGGSSDAWPVRFADSFDRDDGRWKTVLGEASVADGVLRGTLRPNTSNATKFNVALARAMPVRLPTRAEVRFRFKASRPMAVSATLADPTGFRLSYTPILAGACDMAGSPTAFVMQMSVPANDANDLKIVNLGPAKYDQEAGRWHAVRLRRDPDRLRVWVDDALVLAVRIPDADLPMLNLQGAWTAAGETIEFDDVEVRAPDDAVRELEVRTRTREVFDEVLVKAEARRRLVADPVMKPSDISVIDRTLDSLFEDHLAIEEKSWQVVQKADASAEEYALALVRAEAALSHDPDGPEATGTLGIALVRAGRAKDAVPVLERAITRFRETLGPAPPALFAGLALAHHSIGDAPRTKADVVRLRAAMLRHHPPTARVSKAFLAEVEATLGEAAKPDPATDAVFRRVHDGEMAGWRKRDLPAHFDLFAATFTHVTGRGPVADKHDIALDRAKWEAVRRLHLRPPPEPAWAFAFEDPVVTINGDAATLEWRLTVAIGDDFETFGGRYELAKAGEAWRVTSQRSWEIARRRAGELTLRSPDGWAALDKAVDTASNARGRMTALVAAHRLTEALVAAPADAHSDRGELLVRLGDVPAAFAAFAKAEAADPDVRLPWYMSRGRRALRGVGVGAAAYLDADRVISVGNDGFVRIWNPVTGVEATAWDVGEPVFSLAVAGGPKTRVAVAGKGTIFVSDLTGRRLATMEGHADNVYRLHFSPDGSRLVSASQDGTSRVWDAATGKESLKFAGHGKPVLGAVFTLDGRHVVSCGEDSLARRWDAQSGKEVRVFRGHAKGVKRAVLSPDGKRLLTASTDRTVRLWDAETGKQLRVLPGHEAGADAAAFSSDGKWVASGDWNGVIRVCDAGSGAKRLTIADHPGAVYSIAFSPDDRSLIVTGDQGAVVYDLRPHGGE